MAPQNSDLVLTEVSDFESIRALSLKSGLEDGPFEHIAKVYGFLLGKRLVACAALKVNEGVYSVEWLAVDSEMRGRGLGSALVRRVEEESRKSGARKLWAVARAPLFFEKLGFRISTSDQSDGPSMRTCHHCPQYLKSCSPAVVVKFL